MNHRAVPLRLRPGRRLQTPYLGGKPVFFRVGASLASRLVLTISSAPTLSRWAHARFVFFALACILVFDAVLLSPEIAWAEGDARATAAKAPEDEANRDDEASPAPSGVTGIAKRAPPKRETLPGQYPEATGEFYGQGFWAGTPDRAFTIRSSGFVHIDSRIAFDGEDDPTADFYWRRLRIALDGRVFGQVEYRLMWDILFDPVIPYDFHLDWRPTQEVSFRVGGFKSPFGFERRARAYALLFNDRGFPTTLAPNRDIGIFMYGQTSDGFFSYDIAMVTGAQDLGVAYEFRGRPDFAGRVYYQPFRRTSGFPTLHHLGVGLSWTVGREVGREGERRLGRVRAMPRGSIYGGRRLFDWLDDEEGASIANGLRDRQSVHAHWRHGPFNSLFEYTRSAQQVSKGVADDGSPRNRAYLAHQAWQLVLSMTLVRGDQNTFFGVTTTRPFDLEKGDWGGATVSVRYQEIYMDRNTFPTFADPERWAHTVRAVATSLQWHINLLLEAQFDVEYMVPIGGGLPPELALMTRLEARY